MKIFVADVLFHILKKMPVETTFPIINVESAKEIIAVYESMPYEAMALHSEYHFFSSDYKKITAEFKARFEVIEAAGGVVMKNDKILFMKRLSKWDLPKGKIDKGEDYQTAAVREVAEECGVKAKILYKIGCTWHTFIQADKSHKLKKTVWFAMECIDDAQKSPQASESITKVKWTKFENIDKKFLNSYASIIHIYRKFERKQLQKIAEIQHLGIS